MVKEMVKDTPNMSRKPLQEQVEQALAEIVREALATRQTVQVPGLGVFCIERRPALRRPAKEGGAEFIPPRNEIRFTPRT